MKKKRERDEKREREREREMKRDFGLKYLFQVLTVRL